MAIQNGFIQIIQDEKRDYQYEEAMKTLRTNIQFSGNGAQGHHADQRNAG